MRPRRVKTTVLQVLRSLVALAAGAFTLVAVLLGTILVMVPGWMAVDGFPSTAPGLTLLVGLEVLAGAAGAFVAALLAPRAPRAHGWTLGLLVFLLDVLTVADPASRWPLLPAVLLLAFVPLQTWGGIALAIRIRDKRHAAREAAA